MTTTAEHAADPAAADPAAADPAAAVQPPSKPDGLARLATAANLARVRPAHSFEVHNPTIVRTERLLLRPLLETDRDEFVRVAAVNRRHLERTCPLWAPDDHEARPESAFARQLALSNSALATGLAWRRVALDADGRIAGCVAINDIHRGLECTGEIVFWIGVEHSGNGLATELVRAALQVAFADLPRGLGLHRLTALVAPDNTPSRAIMRSGGFAVRPELVPVDLILAGRPSRHDAYAAYAPLAEPSPALRGPAGDARRLARALAGILHTEAAAQVTA